MYVLLGSTHCIHSLDIVSVFLSLLAFLHNLCSSCTGINTMCVHARNTCTSDEGLPKAETLLFGEFETANRFQY